jgi:hypothetical protein
MDKHYDIYITFPDGLPVANSSLATLIDSYISNLNIIVERILGCRTKILVKDKDFDKSNYGQFFGLSTVFIFFDHSFFEINEDYEHELAELCGFLNLNPLDPIIGFSRLFKICLEPDKDAIKPACIENLLPYVFYEINAFNRKINSLDFSTKKNNSIIYRKLLDLAYDISTSLNENQPKTNKKYENQGCIYLGLTNADQQESHDDIRRELQQLGYKILPLANMPVNEEDFKKVLTKYLDISDSVIQLMSTRYGDIPKGFKVSLADLQNRIIKEYQLKDSTHRLKHFVWVPSGKSISDQRQSLYLKRIKHDDAGHNTEIIETPLESFKTIVVSRLKAAKESRRIDYGNIFQVYLLTEETPSKEVDKLYSTLSSSGLKVMTLDFSEQVGIYARHLQKLRDCDSVILFQQEENQLWLDSKIRDLIKSPGIGRIRPFKKVIVVARNKPNEQLLDMINTKIDVIYDMKYDDDLILQKLISE